LIKKFPKSAPHFLYAYNAREWTIPLLSKFYEFIIKEHKIDAIISFDGGSDSLMKGDEEGLGDPLEDAVTVGTIASLKGLKLKVLISIGFGSDRFNQVSDASSLRAVAEITSAGGFLGSMSLLPSSPCYQFYKELVEHVYSRQVFRSVLTGFILAATRGVFGFEVPDEAGNRVRKGEGYIWPLMAILWAFNPETIAKRSLIIEWIKDLTTIDQCYAIIRKNRDKGKKEGTLRGVEDIPAQKSMAFNLM